MSQIQFQANVQNGSNVVQGLNSQFTQDVDVGFAFAVVGDNVTYTVASVTSDTQLTLTAPYGGPTRQDVLAIVVTGYTRNYQFAELSRGDLETAALVTRAMRTIDDALYKDATQFLIKGTGEGQGRTNAQNDARFLLQTIMGTGSSQVRTNSQNEQKFVTTDTEQTIRATKLYSAEDGGTWVSYRVIPEAGETTGSYVNVMLRRVVDLPSNWPTYPSAVTHLIHNRVSGPAGDTLLGGEVWGATDSVPDMAWARGQGVVFGSPSLGFRGRGSINSEALYINGTEIFQDLSTVFTAESGALSNAVSNMLCCNTDSEIRKAIGAGDAKLGSDNEQVRTNLENDERYLQAEEFYRESEVSLGGDFGSQKVKCVRVGNVVTITSTLNFEEGSVSDTGVIPEEFRPIDSSVESAISVSGNFGSLSVSTDGSLTITTSVTGGSSRFTISYVV